MELQQPLTIGIDLGGTSTRVGLYDAALTLVDSRRMPTRVAAGPQSCVEEMAEAVRAMLPARGRVLGVGIGSPGPINLQTGVLGSLPNLPGWDNFPLRDALAEATGLPTILESDANAAAIAEWKLGAGKASGLDSLAMVTLGTGVGSGLILSGRVWHGMFGMGGEVGHATVNPDGPVCGCGTRGCLEVYASANGLIRMSREIAATQQVSTVFQALTGGPFAPHDIAALAAAGDGAARAAFERLGFYLGVGIANLVNTLDLPMIVVGGGLADSWSLFAPAMFRSVREFSTVYRLVTPTQFETLEHHRTFIRPALLGPSAGLLGAAMLPTMAAVEAEAQNASLTPEMAR